MEKLSSNVAFENIKTMNALIESEYKERFDKLGIRNPLTVNRNFSDDDFKMIFEFSVWNSFFKTYIRNKDFFQKNIPYHVENGILNRIDFNSAFYESNKILFYYTLLSVLFEYNFYTGDISGEFFLSKESLKKCEELYPNEQVSFSWIQDFLLINLLNSLVQSKEMKEAKDFIGDLDSKKNGITDTLSKKLGGALEKLEATTIKSIDDINNNYSALVKSVRDGEVSVKKSSDNVLKMIGEIDAIEVKVKKYRQEYNFVGLNDGFLKMKKDKELELENIKIDYKSLFGILLFAPVIMFFVAFFKSSEPLKNVGYFYFVFPVVTFELVLIYFFRLSYLEAKSIRTQLVQIDLRLNLCAFIQGYVEYRKDNGKRIDKLLESFDSLIFSPIQVNDINIPSMFDGIDAIANLANKITKGK